MKKLLKWMREFEMRTTERNPQLLPGSVWGGLHSEMRESSRRQMLAKAVQMIREDYMKKPFPSPGGVILVPHSASYAAYFARFPLRVPPTPHPASRRERPATRPRMPLPP